MDSQELQRLKNKFDIVGNDVNLNRAIETAVAVAPTDLTVLITGESGVGKESIPQIIHQFSLWILSSILIPQERLVSLFSVLLNFARESACGLACHLSPIFTKPKPKYFR